VTGRRYGSGLRTGEIRIWLVWRLRNGELGYYARSRTPWAW